MCLGVLFVGSTPGLPRYEKYCVDVSCPGCTRTHYVISRSHRTQVQHNVSCALFVGSEPDPPNHKKYCAHVSRPGRTRTDYVTCRSHCMQKHKFGITCPGVLFVVSASGPISNENSASTVHAQDAPERIK
jgi:hypothetical protein